MHFWGRAAALPMNPHSRRSWKVPGACFDRRASSSYYEISTGHFLDSHPIPHCSLVVWRVSCFLKSWPLASAFLDEQRAPCPSGRAGSQAEQGLAEQGLWPSRDWPNRASGRAGIGRAGSLGKQGLAEHSLWLSRDWPSRVSGQAVIGRARSLAETGLAEQGLAEQGLAEQGWPNRVSGRARSLAKQGIWPSRVSLHFWDRTNQPFEPTGNRELNAVHIPVATCKVGW
jgi:hypothetical protein